MKIPEHMERDPHPFLDLNPYTFEADDPIDWFDFDSFPNDASHAAEIFVKCRARLLRTALLNRHVEDSHEINTRTIHHKSINSKRFLPGLCVPVQDF